MNGPSGMGFRQALLVLINLAGLALLVVYLFGLHRIPRAPERDVARPGWPTGGSGVAAVIVDRENLESERGVTPPFSERDWSLAWTNTLFQEVGPHAVIDAAELAAADLDRYRLLVIGATASRRIDADAARRLAAWVREGRAVIVETPGVGLEALSGITVSDPGEARHHTGLQVMDAMKLPGHPDLSDLPIYTRSATATPSASDVEALLHLDGEPVVWARPEDRGIVVSVCFDFGLFLTATQQGRPEEDYSVRSRYTEHLADRLETNDLMTDFAYHDNPVPVADLLERALLQLVRSRVFVPALWYWPHGATGVYAMTHDDERWGERAEWMFRDEARRGVEVTGYHVATGRADPATLARARDQGHTLGLQWDRDTRHLVELPRLGPFLQPYSLSEQVANLAASVPDGIEILHNRNHELEWDDQYARSFGELEGAGIRLDSSYGSDAGCRGYLFGTGYPFHPLDVTGMPFKLFELPYQHSEREAGVDAGYLTQLAQASGLGAHTAIISLFHPSFWTFTPSVDTYRLWKALPELMMAEGQVPVTMDEVLRFAEDREGATITVEGEDDTRWRMAYSVSEEGTGQMLVVPETLGGRSLSMPDREVTVIGSLGDTRWLTTPISGSGTVEVVVGGS